VSPSFQPAPVAAPAFNPPLANHPPLSLSQNIGERWEALPVLARAKFLKLRDAADDAAASLDPIREPVDAIRIEKLKAQHRVAQLEQDGQVRRQGGDDHPALIHARAGADRLASEQQRLAARYDEAVERWRPMKATVTALEVYLRYASDYSLETSPPVAAPSLGKGESVTDALVKARGKVETLTSALRAAQDAPLPSAFAKKLAREQVETLAEKGRPAVNGLVEAGLPIAFPESVVRVDPFGGGASEQSLFGSVVDATALFAWTFKDQLLAKLDAEIVEASADDIALSPAERETKGRETAAALLLQERLEEALIELAQASGTTPCPGAKTPIRGPS
jgi:hypothetical protein